MSTFIDADHANGPALFDWVRGRICARDCFALPSGRQNGYKRPGGIDGVLGDRAARALRRGRDSGRVRFDTADVIATALGYHVSEVPDEVWE